MPIYEYYCPDNHKIYQFFAKTLAQGKTKPRCPDNPAYRMEKVVSPFAIATGGRRKSAGEGKAAADGESGAGPESSGDPAEDARMEAAMSAMESEFANVDENDPRAMGRMMRRMAELSGEKVDGEMEEVVRKLEEGADPDSLEDMMGGSMDGEGGACDDPYGDGMPSEPAPKDPRHRYKVRRGPPIRDPKLYDYE